MTGRPICAHGLKDLEARDGDLYYRGVGQTYAEILSAADHNHVEDESQAGMLGFAARRAGASAEGAGSHRGAVL